MRLKRHHRTSTRDDPGIGEQPDQEQTLLVSETHSLFIQCSMFANLINIMVQNLNPSSTNHFQANPL